ncbi:MAG: GNAT family N-acetyltransferase [Clostridia bacterium]|nr:GNAT family N-acetyltransferase [Clostridia bacterium]
MKLNTTPSRWNFWRLYRLYHKAFPLSEKKPFGVMVQKRKEGSMEIMTAEDDGGNFLGIVITILHNDIVLLDYLAVSPACRGQGVGSEILRLLNERYEGKRILLEIEDPEEPCNNQEDRLRRKAFYLRNGWSVRNYKVWLFGIKMLILTNGADVSFEEYHEIFDAVFSPSIGKNVSLAEK